MRHVRTLSTLAVRAVNCSLGQVCKLETYCATCEDTVNSCRASRQLFAGAGMQIGDVLCDMRGHSTLAVRAINCSLGQVCKLETYCATCEDTVNSCRASRQLFAGAGMQVGDVLCDMRGHCQLLPCEPSTVPCDWYASWRRTVRHARTLSTLAVRAVNCSLGQVCKLETYCATCEDTVSSTLSSDRIGGTAGNLPFVVTRSVVSASMDMCVAATVGSSICADTST